MLKFQIAEMARELAKLTPGAGDPEQHESLMRARWGADFAAKGFATACDLAREIRRPVTPERIRALRSEASEAGDFGQVAVCDVALGADTDDHDYESLARDETDERAIKAALKMTQTEALAECARVIAEAAAQD